MSQPQASFVIPCRQCGSPLHRSASGLLCIECRSKIIPSGELSDHYEAYTEQAAAQLPENTCNDAEEIGKVFGRLQKLDSGNISEKQRGRLQLHQDKAFQRMTLDRLKIENENLRQHRIRFEGEQASNVEIQRTLF